MPAAPPHESDVKGMIAMGLWLAPHCRHEDEAHQRSYFVLGVISEGDGKNWWLG